MEFLIVRVLPYGACAIFLVGVVVRVTAWLRTPVPFRLTIFPARAGKGRG